MNNSKRKPDIPKDFWERWYKAGELDKLKILEELPIFEGGNLMAIPLSTTLLNHYFCDLTKYLEEKGR